MPVIKINSLEDEITAINNNGKEDEQKFALSNYSALDNIISNLKANIPYPEVSPWDVGDYDERKDLIFKKNANRKHYIEIEKMKKYAGDGSLYCGHIKVDEADIFLTDKIYHHTARFNRKDGTEFFLVNTDDRTYSHFVNSWRFPTKFKNILLSRNIELKNRSVINVDTVFDKSSAAYSEITDAYLRNALLRNKDSKIQSIIQTIQQKQDYIRTCPINQRFIVQGCAGSGKTMVLLHRLRYLLFNKEISNDDYLFLLPGEGYKNFISDISSEFHINKKNMYSYQEYYAKLIGKEKEFTDVNVLNELLFDNEYLKHVYSEEFIKECYTNVFNNILIQTEELIAYCDQKLSDLSENKINDINLKIQGLDNDILKTVNQEIIDFKYYLGIGEVKSFDEVNLLLDYLKCDYTDRKKQIAYYNSLSFDAEISDDDERLLNDKKLILIQQQIDQELKSLERASRFTRRTHERKLEQLQQKYQEHKDNLINVLLSKSDSQRKECTSKIAIELHQMISRKIKTLGMKLQKVLSQRKQYLKEYEKELDYYTNNFDNIYAKHIELLNKFIDKTVDFSDYEVACVNGLQPIHSYYRDLAILGSELIKCFDENGEDTNFTKYKFFTVKTENQYKSNINSQLFNMCKKTLAEKYDIKIHKSYKHYWYLELYSRYLSNSLNNKARHYIFIDEVQDLSVSEVELIRKVNTIVNELDTVKLPIFNLFGDIHQTISLHGITNWSDLGLNTTIYTLDENFRNTNQIIDYCNERLLFKMTKIGIDMEEVSNYLYLYSCLRNSTSIYKSAVFIVKDDYAKLDLLELLKEFSNIKDFSIYTVKDVKGLEFKEVFVFERGMSDNEKYIAFTRALSKLNVIQDLPVTSHKTNLIVNGTDDEDKIEVIVNNEEVDEIIELDEKILENNNSATENEEITTSKTTTNHLIIEEVENNFKNIKDVVNTIVSEDTPSYLLPKELATKGFDIKLTGRFEGHYYLAPYSGKIKKYTSKKLPILFLPVENKGNMMQIVASIDEEEHIIYIIISAFKAHEKYLREVVEFHIN